MNLEKQSSFKEDWEPKRKSPNWVLDKQDISQMQRSWDNIFVAVRVWPMFDDELINGDWLIIRVLDNWVVVLFDPEDIQKSDLDLKAMGKKWHTEH